MNLNRTLIDKVEFAKALADETRQQIMTLCCCKWVSVNTLADILSVAQPTVSHHLKILKKANLVHSERKGKQIFYTLNQERLAKGCCQVAADFAPDLPIYLHVNNVK